MAKPAKGPTRPATPEELAAAAPVPTTDITQQLPPEDAGKKSAGRVFVTDTSGGVFDVDKSEADQLDPGQYRKASKQQIDQTLTRERLGTADQQVRTALERAAGTASFGATDYLASQISPELADEMRLRAETNPVSGGIGKVAGFLAPGAAAKMFKGVRGVGAAAELAAAPLEGMSAAGQFAERVTQGLVGTGAESLLGRVAQKGLASAARMGTEGAIIGAGDAISEASLGPDHELTAEKVLAGAKDGFGVGALFGGALGGVEAVGGAALDKVKRMISPRDVEALAERQFGEAAPGLGEAWAKASAAASGKDIDAIRTLGPQNLGEAGREARRVAVYEGDAMRDAAKRAVRDHIDELNGATKNLQEEYMGGLKPGHVERSIRKGQEALDQQLEFAQGHVADIRSKVTEMLADRDAFGQVADLKKMDRFLNLADRGIADAAAEGSGTKAYVELDNLKKRLGKLAKPGTFMTTSSDMAVSGEVRGLYENLRQGLEDEGMWGKTAIDQQRINKAWAKYLDTKNLFEQRLSTPLGRDPANPWVRNTTADPAKIDGYVNGLTSPKNDLIHQTIRDHLANSQDLAEAITQLADLDPARLAEFGKVIRSTEGFKKTIDQAEKTLTLSNQLKALEAGDSGGFGSMGGLLGGLAFGGPVGAAVGAVAGALTRPGQAVRQLAAIERLGARVDSEMFDGVKAFGKKAVRIAKDTATDVGRAAVRSGIDDRIDYHSAVSHVADAASAPDRTQARLDRMLGDETSRAAPNVSASIAKRNVDTLAYLQSKIPTLTAPAGGFPSARHPEPADTQMGEFLRAFEAAKDPMSVVKDFEKGKLSPEGVEAFRKAAPKLHEKFVGMLTSEAAELAADGKELPYDAKLELWQLTGVATDPTLDPAFIAKIQAMHSSARGSAPEQANAEATGAVAPKRKIDTADSHMTMSEKLESP